MDFEVCVIGAGAVGISIARKFSMNGKKTLLIEKNKWFGAETSSRNSEVIHAGIYYETNSLKKSLSIKGKNMLYRYAERNNIPHAAVGKLIVASASSQLKPLQKIYNQGISNGLTDLRLLSKGELNGLEPHLRGEAAIHSPSTGIIDSHALMLQELTDFENTGGIVSYNTSFKSAIRSSNGWVVSINDADDFSFTSRIIINAAGHSALNVGKFVESNLNYHGLRNHFVKGNYFSLTGAPPFSHLIYPIPEKSGLGIHSTRDLSGRTKFGPDVDELVLKQRIQDSDYAVNKDSHKKFVKAIACYYPDIVTRTIIPDYCGIRPKMCLNGDVVNDFIFRFCHCGSASYVELLGIESPGLTASLAIGDAIFDKLKEY